MLTIRGSKSARKPGTAIITFFAVILLLGGAYLLALILSPVAAPIIATPPIKVTELPAPIAAENRIVIPKLGVNIAYAPGQASLDKGAEWRHPDRGDPANGGNFIIAAHRFSIQPTPQGTIEKSPFYRIDQLAVNDKIIVDYLGVRYAYSINKIFDVKPTQTEIEATSDTPKLTLYSCELGGSEAGRIVITASPMGKVALGSSGASSSENN